MTKLLQPLPRPLDGPLRSEANAQVHRRFHCPHYAACLSESVRQSWESFTCLHCPLQSMYAETKDDLTTYAQKRSPSAAD